MATTEKAAAQRGRRTASRPAPSRPAQAPESAPSRHGTTVPIPVITPRVRVVRLAVPGPGKVLRLPIRGVSQAASAGRKMSERLPSTERAVFLGGLGAAAVFGVIEWPVAAAIGIGTVIARRALRPGPSEPAPGTTGSGAGAAAGSGAGSGAGAAAGSRSGGTAGSGAGAGAGPGSAGRGRAVGPDGSRKPTQES